MIGILVNAFSLQEIVYGMVIHVELITEGAHGCAWGNESLLYLWTILLEILVDYELTVGGNWFFIIENLFYFCTYTRGKLCHGGCGNGLVTLALLPLLLCQFRVIHSVVPDIAVNLSQYRGTVYAKDF